MKKILVLLVSLTVLLLFAGCAAEKEESSVTPTGYPSGQIQRVCVYYNGTLFVARDGGRLEDMAVQRSLEEVGTVKTLNDRLVPSEEFAAAHMDVGTKLFVYRSKSGGKDRLFYQIDKKQVWELEPYPYAPETLGPVK